MRIIDLFTSSVAKHPSGIAVKQGSAEITYLAMSKAVDELAGRLAEAGCHKGDRIAIILDNSIGYLVSFFAVSCADCVIVPLSAKMTSREMMASISLADVAAVITDESHGQTLANAAYVDNLGLLVSGGRSSDALQQLRILIRRQLHNDVDDCDLAMLIPTSGSTGQPKIAALTHENLISNMMTYCSVMAFNGHNVAYCGLPFNHIYCICAQILPHVSLADTLVLGAGPFFAKDFLKIVESCAVSVAAFVPYMAILLADFPCPYGYDASSLMYITLSGGKTPTWTQELLRKKYPHVHFVNTYGMTEAGSRIAVAAPLGRDYPIDSVGRPMPGVNVKITDMEGKTLAPGSIGQVEVQSSGVMRGYYRQPDLTAETVKDGWLETGDLGRFDEAGNLFLEGRMKDIIVSGGENILPSEVEQCLLEYDGILEAAVVPQPDRLLQEVPCAFVVKRQTHMQFEEGDIIRFCRKRLSSQKVPRQIRFIQELPRLSTSKVDRSTLREVANSSVEPVNGNST
jgi:long-chain acyl-CoA synthetase